ncbi:MAG: hypothetical protein JW702_05645 [Clostridiales bacterium]|nr:hypothetical protein [Clostridiales bacterium]
MDFFETIVDELKKHNLLIYFIILWGGSMFLYAVANLATWGFGIEDAYDVFWIIGNLFDLVSGALLALFGLKLMNTEFLKEIPIEKIFAYFLLLWSGQFIFWGLSDILYFEALWLLAGLVHFIAGIVIALFAWKMLNEPTN